MSTDSGERRSVVYDLGRILCRCVAAMVFDLKVRGLRHIPREGGFLLVCSHQSYLDPVLYAVCLSRQVSFFAKAELFRVPGCSWLIRELHAFPVRRGEADLGAVKEAIRRVQAGAALLVFPEGTRTRDGNIKSLEAGVGLLARRAGVPVIPAVIDGAWQCWQRGSRLPRPGPVRVAYGPPLAVSDLRPAQIVQLVDATLRRMLAELRAEAQPVTTV
jgi:1-acyl-sn-glycerol-3-phosphate acyltransferase